MAQDRFLSRWSRRKAQNRRPNTAAGAAVAETAAAPAIALDESPPDPDQTFSAESPAHTDPGSNPDVSKDAADLSEAELREKAEELGLPDPESLGPGSDFKQFMAPDVPKQLRSLALRRLWRSNPVLANLDGLVDYGEDFTDAALVVANMQTAYQVGRGYRRDEETEPEVDEADDLETAEESELEGTEEPEEVALQSADQEDVANSVEGKPADVAKIENHNHDTDRRQDVSDRT